MAFREPAFRPYIISRAGVSTANNLFQAAVAWQVYAITGSAAQLGIIGLIRFLPVLGLNLVAGAAVDTYDRRTVAILAELASLLTAVAVIAAIATDRVTLPLLYFLVLVAGCASSFDMPARQALLQGIVQRSAFRPALVMNQTVSAIGSVTGPAIAGVLIAWQGAGAAYGAYAALLALSISALLLVHVTEEVTYSRRGVSLKAMLEGLTYVWHQRLLLGAMTLDLFAVIFGGATALLPVYAVSILHSGAAGYGILVASNEVGSMLCALALLVLPVPRATGRAIFISVILFGVATILFGVSTSFPVAVLFYAAVGMADQVSVVLRQLAIQLSTPDELRGRVTSVNSVFTNSSNQIGAMESGFVAAFTSATFAVVSGGVAVLGVVALVAWLLPELRGYRAHETPIPVDAGAQVSPV